MPPKYGDNHNQYLFKYLSTGEKKVVGKSRDVEGQKKDGTLFPINLSVSEVIDEAFHIFTGVVRDMTKSYSTEAARLDKEKKKQDELKQLMVST